MEYEKRHVVDINIEDETQRHGRDVTISVDTHEMINIEIGNTVTIRTDEAGADDLREALNRALVQIENIRYDRVSARLNQTEEELIQAGIDARETVKTNAQSNVRSEQQQVDPYDNTFNPNDPVNW